MANLFKLSKFISVLALILSLSVSSSSSARLLRDLSLSPAALPDLKLDTPADHTTALAVEYGALLLGFLPKGGIPPSGPSKGTNNLNS
ncbi:hypothetical protein SDJN03_07821, partial [Cucurbita argyrosperma subsp. sororia]